MSEEEGRRDIQQCGNNAVQNMLTTPHGDLFKINIFQWSFKVGSRLLNIHCLLRKLNHYSKIEMFRMHSGPNQGFLSNGCIGCIYLVKILANCAPTVQCCNV